MLNLHPDVPAHAATPPMAANGQPFWSVARAADGDAPLPPLGLAVQLVGRLVDVDTEHDVACLEDPAAADGAPGRPGGIDAQQQPRLLLDTALLPPDDLHAVPPRGLVHVFGTLLAVERPTAGADGAVPPVAAARVLRLELLRPLDSVDPALLSRTLQLRERFTARFGLS